MAIWRRGESAKSRGPFSPVLVQDENRMLVFGADWSPLIGGRAASTARSKAAQFKATHYALVTKSGHSGLATVKLTRAEMKLVRKRDIFPAAAAFAMFRPAGTGVGLFELDDRRIWIVLCQNGMIRRNGDLVYTDQDMAYQRFHQLQQEAEALEPTGPNWSFFSNLDIPHTEHISLEELLRVDLKPFETRRFSLDQLPKPVKVSFLLMLIIFGASAAWDVYDSFARSRRLAELRANMQDPEIAWRTAVREEAARKRVDSVKSVEALYEQLIAIPLEVAGWTLRSATCSPAGSLWECLATFQRKGYGATNDQFEAALPKGWRAEFDPLGTATGAWTFKSNGTKTGVTPETLPTRDKILRSPVSQLQSILPAFTSIRLPTTKAWEVAMPFDGNGKPVSKPSTLMVPGAIPLVLEGPLRSLSVWEVESTPTAIRTIKIDRVDADVSLNSSPLKMTLNGDLYVQNAK